MPEVTVTHIGGEERELGVDIRFFAIPPQELRIPGQVGHRFQSKLATRSGVKLATYSGMMLAAHSDAMLATFPDAPE